jgi:membrane-associated protease RseP (regulator of RpoE activity)
MFSATPWAIPFIFLGPTLAVLVHELGHAFAAWRLGMAVKAISVGPLVLRFLPTRLKFSDHALGHDVGGYVLYDESAGRYLTRRTRGLITLAGPFANLLAAVITYVGGRLLGEGAVAALLVGFAFTSLAAFVISAWPFKLESGRGNDALEFIRDQRVERPIQRRAPKRSPWQAP